MASKAHEKTLFHLVPTNHAARDALLHPDNKRFVSKSICGPGLEVGYHVPSVPRGHVITRLGRDADLILCQSTPEYAMSAVHVAFEISPATHLILLSVRSKRVSSVRFKEKRSPEDDAAGEVNEKEVTGDGVLLYGQNYEISIASYKFDLVWRTIASVKSNTASLKTLTIQGYEGSLHLLQDVRSRDQPTENDFSEAQSWHITRFNTANGPLFQDVKHLRAMIGEGAYGTVYKAVDRTSGRTFAIKVVTLNPNGNVEAARATLHREIKVMERVKHTNIIEYLGHQFFHTLQPEIFMPLRDGSLTSLAKSPTLTLSHDKLCFIVMEQMLSALDYLSNEKLIHRDLKPDNILYSSLRDGGYLFQLADFGLAHHSSLAITRCGTGYYQAPELWPQFSKVYAGQSPKLDIWSLFASIIAVRSRFKEFPPNTTNYGVVLSALKAKALVFDKLKPMARLHPDCRASAAQMLVLLFDGKGLTTPISKISPIEPDAPAAGPSSHPQTRNDHGKVAGQLATAANQLIVYPPRRRTVPPDNSFARIPPAISNRVGKPTQPAASQLQPIRTHKDGVVKRRAESRAPGANMLARNPPKQDPPVPRKTLYRIPGEFPEEFVDRTT